MVRRAADAASSASARLCSRSCRLATPVSWSCSARKASWRCNLTRTSVCDAWRPSAFCSSKNWSSNCRARPKKQTRIPSRRRSSSSGMTLTAASRVARSAAASSGNSPAAASSSTTTTSGLLRRLTIGGTSPASGLVPPTRVSSPSSSSSSTAGLARGERGSGDLGEGLRDVLVARADAEGARHLLQDPHLRLGRLRRPPRVQEIPLVLDAPGRIEHRDADHPRRRVADRVDQDVQRGAVRAEHRERDLVEPTLQGQGLRVPGLVEQLAARIQERRERPALDLFRGEAGPVEQRVVRLENDTVERRGDQAAGRVVEPPGVTRRRHSRYPRI